MLIFKSIYDVVSIQKKNIHHLFRKFYNILSIFWECRYDTRNNYNVISVVLKCWHYLYCKTDIVEISELTIEIVRDDVILTLQKYMCFNHSSFT